MKEPIDIKSLTLQELESILKEKGLPAFRAGQIFAWLHVKHVSSFEEMSNLSKALRDDCGAWFSLTALEAVAVQESALDGTKKFLFRLADGHVVESVFMPYAHGNSVCISSQVGCRMGCRFCASTLDGLARNLTPAEMLDQIYAIGRLTNQRISNVVVMGTGEPLDNYENLLRFLHLLCHEKGLHISQRNVTVSTCGLAEKIAMLAKEHLQITLALSLHAVTDEKRRALMPIANRYSIQELMEVCACYFQETGRRISFEYSLVENNNDTLEDAKGLIALAKPLHAHVNLIPVNPIKERDYVRSNRGRVLRFQQTLQKAGVNATVRREMGSDIDGACGQLRRRYEADEAAHFIACEK